MNIVEKIRNDEIFSLNDECTPLYGEKRGKRQKTIVKKIPKYGKRTTASGKRVRAGTEIIDTDGVATTLLTPAGKGAKYADELKNNRRITNDGKVKTDKRGRAQKLTPKQRAYRGGYLQAQKDAANVYKAKNSKGGKK